MGAQSVSPSGAAAWAGAAAAVSSATAAIKTVLVQVLPMRSAAILRPRVRAGRAEGLVLDLLTDGERLMAKRWVLDTETKGTGAQMVPLEKAHGGGEARGPIVVGEPQPRPAPASEARTPPRFKVVDVMTRQTLAEGVGTREAVRVLEGMRSVVDVNVYVWREREGDWLQLSQGDRRRLWNLRGRSGGAAPAGNS